MEFPAELRAKIDELTEHEDLKALAQTAEKLSENYRNEQGNGKISAASRREILAYSAVRMPATFGAVSRALELSLSCFDGKINSVLDVGAGTGTGAIAACLITGCTKISCLERQKNMIELGEQFCGCMGITAEWTERDISLGILGKADLVICSYCLNELPESLRKKSVSELANAADKLLVIVEPGTPASFANIKEFRKTLLNKGLSIAAPCPSACLSECPVPENDWCHFTERVARSKLCKLLKGADVPYEDEKFCFLAAAKESASPCAGRVLKKPFIKSGRITLNICSENGVSAELVTKNKPLFKAARKAESGDEFPPRRTKPL